MAELTASGPRSPVSIPVLQPSRTVRGLPAQLSHASGGRDVWSDPLPEAPEDPLTATWDLLHEVLDPELPISLVDLGLIYGLEVEDGVARIRVTFTATACPCMEFIREDITDRLLQESWLKSVEIEEVWDPPWTTDRISERGRAELRRLGVGA